jgi:hypothetical protein
MDITTKITRDVNQFKSVPSSQVLADSSGWSISSIFTPYTIGIVVVILAMFGAWFAWDWYKNHHVTSSSTPTTQTSEHQDDQPIGGSTIKPTDGHPPPPPHSSQSMPPVVTTMSPIQYAKYQSDQKALETALGSRNQGGGEPVPDDAADGAGKAGWCYIGEDQGLGVCASVQPKDQCMSGQVFPTESECRQYKQ